MREKRSLDNPLAAGQDILAGAVNPTLGAVQTLTYNATAAKDQSLYAQEQVLMLQQRLALTAGVTAERTTNDGDIDKFYPYPRFSASYRVPQFAGWFDELKLRAAYGQSGTQPNYGVKYTPFNTTVSGGLGGYTTRSPRRLAIRPEHEAEIETGFDATLFHSRAQFSVTVYQKRITDLLLQANVAVARLRPAVVQRRRVHQPGDRAVADGDAGGVAQRIPVGQHDDVLPELQRGELPAGAGIRAAKRRRRQLGHIPHPGRAIGLPGRRRVQRPGRATVQVGDV